jgi:hypothetical protein
MATVGYGFASTCVPHLHDLCVVRERCLMTTEESTKSAREIYAENLKHQRKLHKLS